MYVFGEVGVVVVVVGVDEVVVDLWVGVDVLVYCFDVGV